MVMSIYPSRSLSFILAGLIFFSPLCLSILKAADDAGLLANQAKIYRDQGFALQEKGNLEEALSYYQKALIIDPTYVVAYNDVGIIFEGMGYKDQAKDMYLKAIDLDPRYPNSYSNLAMLYEEEKDYARAIVCWVKRATLGDPDDPWAEAARRRLEEIARVFPGAYGIIGDSEAASYLGSPAASDKLQAYSQPSGKVSLFRKDPAGARDVFKTDSRTNALTYLNRAKQNFARGEYVLALKEATVAEYMDPSNKEISAFVNKVRKALFQ